MLKPHPRAFRNVLMLLLVLALSAVFSTSAQSTDLTQFAKTLDGQISVHLPDGWQSRDAANPYFTSILAFGDTAASLQGVVDSLATTQTTTVTGMNGVIGIINPQMITGLPAELAINTLINSLISSAQQIGGRVVQQESTMIGNQYPGTIAIISNTGQDAAGIVGVFQAGAEIVEFSIGASPARNFDSNQELFFNVMDSIRVPAEEGVPDIQPAQPTAVQVNPVNPVQPAGEGGVVAAPSGNFSVRLPQGYVSGTISVINFADIIAFGDSATTEEAVAQMFTAGTDPANFSGIAGIVGEVDPRLINNQALAGLAAPLLQSMLAAVQTGTVSISQQPQQRTFGGQYPGQLAELNVGYLGVLHNDEHLLVVFVITDNVDANRAQIDAILDSIRIPAEAASPAIPTTSAPTPVAVQPTESAPVELGASVGNNFFSISIPGDWSISDFTTGDGVLAFGSTTDAADARLHPVKPDLAPELPVTGSGGVVILYPMSQFNIDPENPDLAALMERALGNLQGYSVEQDAQPLPGIGGALYALISGTGERGYLALIPVGDQVLYVTATSVPGDFEENQATLLAILQSIEPPFVPTTGGLSGLGGLEVTPEATPEATSAPITGL